MLQPENNNNSKFSAFFSSFFTKLSKVFSLIWQPVRWLLRQLFGNIAWQQPAWIGWSGRQAKRGAVAARANPKRSLIGLLILALLIGGGWYGYRWWQAQPKPVEVTFKVDNPGRTEIELEDPAARMPKPVVITFDDSAATLAAVGKDVIEGITGSPAVAGV